MTFVESVRTCLTKYADFKGCASRSEFWWWVLFNLAVLVVLSQISDKLAAAFNLAVLLPGLAVAARRLHDTDRSGWFQLIGIIPVVGWVVLIYFYVQEAKRPNRYEEPIAV